MFGFLNIYHHQFMNIPLLVSKVFSMQWYILIWMKKLREWCTNMEIDNIDQFSNKTDINNDFEYSFT